MELKYIVYITINLCNGKFYIGVHETNPDVFDGYIGCGVYRLSNANKKFAFHSAVRKYGYDKFKRTTLRIFPHTEEGKKQAYQLEAELVTPTVLRSKQCYNTSVGGQGGVNPEYMHTVYQYTKEGKFVSAYPSIGIAAHSINTDNYESAKQAIKNNCAGRSTSAFGYVWSRDNKFPGYKNRNITPVAQYTLSGKFLRTFNSIEEADLAMQVCTINQAVLKHCLAAGYQWRRYTGNDSDILPYIGEPLKIPYKQIVMYDKKGNKIGEYDNAQDCKKQHPELSVSQINRVLRNIIHSHKGFVFKFKDKDIV